MDNFTLQEVIIVVDSSTTIYGYAPQYIYNESTRQYENVTTDKPHWSIKKSVVNGNTTTIRWAEGDNYYNKILDNWNSYTY